MAYKRISAEEAASLIRDKEMLALSGFTPSGCPKGIFRALSKRAIKLHEDGEEFAVGILTGASTCQSIEGDMAAAKALRFREGTKVLDFGTGGGFPGIPLAIMFPECQFTLIDGTRKKILVVNEVAHAIGLENVQALQIRGEEEKGKYDFVVTRAVMVLPDLVRIVRKNINKKNNNAMPNGILALKGGDVSQEIHPFKNIVDVMDIGKWFQEGWFKGKHLIYLPI